MDGHAFGLVELLLVFGVVIAWGVWEIWSTRRSLRKDLERAPSESDPRKLD